MSFEPGSTHIAHVTVKNEAKKPYTYQLGFFFEGEGPGLYQEIGSQSVSLGAEEEKTIDVEITFWEYEGVTDFLISAYEEITGTDFGYIYAESISLEIISPPEATVSISWD